MCWVFVRKTDNHQVATASRADRRQLWHAGDVIEILEDGAYIGPADESTFHILELPGVSGQRLWNLLADVRTANNYKQIARRAQNLDLTMLRSKLTGRERSAMNTGKKILLTDGERKLNESTKIRVA